MIVLHSWVRWILLGLGLATLVLSARGWRHGGPWTRVHERLTGALGGGARVQVGAGLVLLLWASPVATLAWKLGLRASFHAPVLAWFGFVHPVMMIISVGVLESGLARARRVDSPQAKHRAVTLAICAWLALVLVAIPWPGLPWGRSLVP